jgi:transcriptional regulator with XRE-family HTH domain
MKRLSSQTDKEKKLVRLGAAIRAMRKDLGMSQEELALLSGVERGNMGKIERGENNLSVLNLERIAKAVNSTAAEILLRAKI